MSKPDQTYLGTDDLPLAPLVILGCHSQGVDVLLLPHAETLAQTLVLHLQAGGGMDDVLAFGEAGCNVFPRECFGLAKLDEETVIVGEGVGGRRCSAPALIATGRTRFTRGEGCCFVFVPLTLGG